MSGLDNRTSILEIHCKVDFKVQNFKHISTYMVLVPLEMDTQTHKDAHAKGVLYAKLHSIMRVG